MKKALITGITGQDGSYLAELLLSKGYKVFGIVRRTSTPSLERIEHIKQEITIIPADMLDQNSLINAVKEAEPDEVYNLAGQSYVAQSWREPVHTSMVTAIGVTKILEAIKHCNLGIRFYQASSSEMFGKAQEVPQTEKTPFYPRSPYGISKLYGHWMTINYRESYKIFACCGILFNHESPRRGMEFVTRKVSDAVARIKLGLQKELRLGNLEAKRDWGYAGDYIQAMWMMLQQEKPTEYVICSGATHSVKELCETAFDVVGLNYKDFVKVDSQLFRPADVEMLVGDYSKAKRELGWEPKVPFEQLIRMMVEEDLKRVKREIELQKLSK